MSGFANGKPMSKIGKTLEELIKTNMTPKDYIGRSSKVKGVVNVELTMGNKTLLTTIFIIEGNGSYAVLLGRDWIQASCCIPSMMHECLIQWVGDEVKIMPADKTVYITVVDCLDKQIDSMRCISFFFLRQHEVHIWSSLGR